MEWNDTGLWISISILAAGIALAWFTRLKERANKPWTSTGIIIITIILAGTTFVQTLLDSKQQNRIEDYSKISKELGETNKRLGESNEALGDRNREIGKNILLLTNLNQALAEETKRIVAENKKLSVENLKLANQNNTLGQKIFGLSEAIRDLNTGGNAYPNLLNVTGQRFGEGIQHDGDRLHVYIEINNLGDFAIDNLKIKGYEEVDYINTDPVFLWTQLSTSGLNIHSRFAHMNSTILKLFEKSNPAVIDFDKDVFKPGQRELIGPLKFKKDFEYYGIIFFF